MAGRPPVYKTCPLCLRKLTAREMQAHKCPRASDMTPKEGEKIRLREPSYTPVED